MGRQYKEQDIGRGVFKPFEAGVDRGVGHGMGVMEDNNSVGVMAGAIPHALVNEGNGVNPNARCRSANQDVGDGLVNGSVVGDVGGDGG